MNHKKAIPANGTKSSASPTALLRPGSTNQGSGSVKSAGIAYRTSPKQTIMRTEKITPAMAAPRGGARACWPEAFALVVIGLAVLRYCVQARDDLGQYRRLRAPDQPTWRGRSRVGVAAASLDLSSGSPLSEAVNSASRKKGPLRAY